MAQSGYEVVITRSGARAMLDRASGEVMHPVVGPRAEAEHLYMLGSRLAERLQAAAAQPLVLLDVGLGAGSNAIAAWHVARASGSARRLEIVSFDRSVGALELALRGEHAADFGLEGAAGEAARELIRSHRHEHERCSWRLRLGEIVTGLVAEPAASADVVFWDPFSPRHDPTLWSVTVFGALRRVCRAGATVHTYSGAMATRSALLLAGFSVGFGPSAGNKQKHTTIAARNIEDLAQPLDRRWFDRLTQSTADWPADAPPDALARLASLPQFAGG